MYVAALRQLKPHHVDWLDQTERSRRSRLRNPADRDRFTLGAALLRAAVAGTTGRRPSEVRIERPCDQCGEPHGRPRVADLEVSVSHSAELVAVAVTTAGPTGIDVEAETDLDYEPLLTTVCAPQEKQFVRSTADFLAYWTRKEAVLKATGQGLRTPMTDLAVTPPDEPPALLSPMGIPCQMADLELPDGYAGAVAVLTDARVRVRCVE